MTRALPLLLVLALALAAPATASAEGCDPALDAWAAAGFSGSVVLPGCVAGYGLADRAARRANTPRTVFSIGSVSKAFTAAAILGLVEEGRLRLDDRAGALVPGVRGPAAGATVAQLLLHTAGLTGSHGDDHEPLSHDQAVAAMAKLERAAEPDTEFLYSNAGYTLLALIVQARAGAPYREHLARRVLLGGGFWEGEPAAPGPRAVGYLDTGRTTAMGQFRGPHWALAGNGDLAMTAPELAAWTRALFTGPLAPRVLGLRFPLGGGATELPGWVRFDARRFGAPLIASAGGGGDVGHDAVVAWLERRREPVVIISNTNRVRAEDLLQRVAPALVAGRPLPHPRPVTPVAPRRLAPLSGTYRLRGDGGRFAVRARGRRLAVTAVGRAAIAALFPRPADVTARDVAEHERRVRRMLAGAGAEGRRERAGLTRRLGRIRRIEIAGTIVADGELRTYATIRSRRRAMLTWWAVDHRGGIGAAAAPTQPPRVELVADGSDRRFRPDAPTAADPRPIVRFRAGRVTVGAATAVR